MVLIIVAIEVGILLRDRKSTRLNSSHVRISYAVFCLKKKRSTQSDHRRLGQFHPRRADTALARLLLVIEQWCGDFHLWPDQRARRREPLRLPTPLSVR